MFDKQKCLSLPTFIVNKCRQYHLFPNERTTILSQADDLQVLQYCLAFHNQKNGNTFTADPREVLDMFEILKQALVKNIENAIEKYYSYNNLKAHNVDGAHCSSSDRASDPQFVNMVHSLEEPEQADRIKQISVFQIYQDYKKKSNHWSVFDAYLHFVQNIADGQSDLYISLKSSCEMNELTVDETDITSIQIRIIDLLKTIVEPSTLTKDVCSNETLPLFPLEAPGTPTGSQVSCSPRHETVLLDMSATPRTPYSPSQKKELQKLLIQDIFRSYLHLLINSRSQMAFARVFNIPERELDHLAFTHLKHEASHTGLSMYQTLSSYIRRIHLGGSGYAPSIDNPLMKYIKGLEMLLELTQKLQTVLEEEQNLKSACHRIVSIIKINLVRCKSGKFPRTLVEPEAVTIENKLLKIVQELETNRVSSPERAISAGGTVLGRKCVQVIQVFLDQSAVVTSDLDHHWMSDIQISSQSPSRVPSLLTQFRSPAIVDLDDKDDVPQQKFENHKQRKAAVAECSKQFVSSAFYLDKDQTSDSLLISQNSLSAIEVIPSKTIVHFREDSNDGFKTRHASHNSNSSLVLGKGKKSKGDKCTIVALGQENKDSSLAQMEDVIQRKRPLSQDIDSSPKSSRAKSGQNGKSAKSSCRRRLLPQVKGQVKITGFFRL